MVTLCSKVPILFPCWIHGRRSALDYYSSTTFLRKSRVDLFIRWRNIDYFKIKFSGQTYYTYYLRLPTSYTLIKSQWKLCPCWLWLLHGHWDSPTRSMNYNSASKSSFEESLTAGGGGRSIKSSKGHQAAQPVDTFDLKHPMSAVASHHGNDLSIYFQCISVNLVIHDVQSSTSLAEFIKS